jgi:SAM-dependent methyltransferase
MTMLLPRKDHLEFARHHECSPQLYYSPLLGPFYRKKLQLMIDLLPVEPVGTIVEVGYGAGIALKELSRRARSVAAIDVHHLSSHVELMLDRENVHNVKLYRHNIFSEPFTVAGSFDYAFSCSVFEHLQHEALAVGISNIAKCLVNGGRLLVGFPLKTRMMNFLFKAYEATYKRLNDIYDFRLEHDHPSGENDIVPALQKSFHIERRAYFINEFLKLYVVLKCQKK